MSCFWSNILPFKIARFRSGAALGLVIAVIGPFLWNQIVEAAPLEDQVVRLLVSKRDIDESSPWQFEDVTQQTHLGVVLSEREILTTAFAVANASSLEMQRFGASQKHDLEIVFVDYEINLAIIRTKISVTGLSPVTFGSELSIDDSVDIYRARDSDQLIKMSARLQDVSVLNGVTSTYSAVAYQFKIQQTGLGWSEPIFKDGKFVAIGTGQDSQFVHAIPLPLIEHMLKDGRGASYRGFPTAGLSLSPLVSPDMRRYLETQASGLGVRITDIMPGSPFALSLKVDDIIVAVDGTPINDQGYFQHPRWGKIPLKYLINQHYSGEILKLNVLRRGKPIEASGKLQRYDSNRNPVVARRYGQSIPHLIFGGLIFQELSIDYLKQWGKEWQDLAPIQLLYVLEYANKPDKNPERRIIFLSRVLADPINRGYADISRKVVEAVNGKDIHSMDDLRRALENPLLVRGKKYAQIQLASGAGEVILAYEDLPGSHKRIAKTYEITSAASFFDSSKTAN